MIFESELELHVQSRFLNWARIRNAPTLQILSRVSRRGSKLSLWVHVALPGPCAKGHFASKPTSGAHPVVFWIDEG
jgi:hypothetical protein